VLDQVVDRPDGREQLDEVRAAPCHGRGAEVRQPIVLTVIAQRRRAFGELREFPFPLGILPPGGSPW